MRRPLAPLAAILVLASQTAGFGQDKPLGFAPRSRADQARAEARAMLVPTPERARGWLRALTEEPHVAGTPADYKTALMVRDNLREWGWQADLAEYEVLLNYPVAGSVKLEIIGANYRALKTTEDVHLGDKDSASADAFPAFHGYGVSGDVSGQVVYANYGRPEDFKALEKIGIDVKGKLVLTRYGGLFRGLKVRNAQQRGAKGVLIFSDPADDGYAQGDVYPNGPFRPASAIQRGSVQFLSLGPGDPSTPNGASVKGAKRLPLDVFNGFPCARTSEFLGTQSDIDKSPIRAHYLPDGAVAAWEKSTGIVRNDYFAAIPSLPISYESAKPILEALAGPNVPAGWQGGLPLAYHIGPGPAEVHMAITMDYKIRPIWNVIATLKGSAEPDRWVMVGNHRDAWTYGAVDPSSGTAATLETCRALGEAVKTGWKPRRTLMYASWDAEEYGLVGSTEWAEEHAAELDQKAVLMLNVDSAVSGPELSMEGVPSLRDLILGAAGEVMDVRSGKTLKQVWLDKQRAAWAASTPVDLINFPKYEPKLGALGSGSDYTAFLDHLGIPCADVGFGGRYGVYHSIYDNFYWMEKFGDPEFLTHATSARLYTLIAMRAAGSEIAPLTFAPYAKAIADEVEDLRRIVARKAMAVDRPTLAFDGLPSLLEAVAAFKSRAEALDAATLKMADRDGVHPATYARVNDLLTKVERSFLLPAGLPGRPFFKHSVYAPGLTTGYAPWPLPGVRQAILEDDPKLLASQLPALVERLKAVAEAIKAATDAAL